MRSTTPLLGSLFLFCLLLGLWPPALRAQATDSVTVADVSATETVLGLTLTAEERAQLLEQQQFFQDLLRLREA